MRRFWRRDLLGKGLYPCDVGPWARWRYSMRQSLFMALDWQTFMAEPVVHIPWAWPILHGTSRITSVNDD